MNYEDFNHLHDEFDEQKDLFSDDEFQDDEDDEDSLHIDEDDIFFE